MAKNLSWTSSLGEAYHNQQSDVMAAIQTLRHQAQAAGKLKSGSQITVVQQSPQTIVIEPSFTPESINNSGTTTLTISTQQTSPIGFYALTIRGTGAGVTHSAGAALTIR